MGEGGENGDSKENCNDRQNTDRNLTFNKYGSVNEEIKVSLADSVMPAGKHIPIKVSIPLHKLSKCYRSNAKNISGKETVNKTLNFGVDEVLDLSIIDINSSGIQNLGKEDSLKSFNSPSVVSNAAENQVREVERVSTKVNETCDSTLFLNEEQKRMTKSIASAVLKMFNQNDINNTLGNMTLKDILNAYSGSCDMTSGHSLITKAENNNIEVKRPYLTPHLPLQNMKRLENNPTFVNNNISKSNEDCFVPDLEENRRHETVSSLALSMYDKNYICNNSGVNKFNSVVHHDLGSNNKLSNSSNLNSSAVKNLNVEESYENRPPPAYLGKKRFVVEPKDGVLKVINTPNDNVLPSQEQSFGNKTISSCILRMDDKSPDNGNLDGKTLVPVSLETITEEMVSILSDLDNDANTSVLNTLEAETSEDTDSSSSDDSELDVCDDNLSSLTSISSSNISEHSVSNDASVIMDYSLPRNRETTDFQHDFDINSIQDCVSYEPVCSKQPSTNIHSLYKKRVRVRRAQKEKDEQLERRRVELEKERDDLKNQVSNLEMLIKQYSKIATELVFSKQEQK